MISDIAELGVEGVEISGGGEPLCYPRIVSAVAFMRSRGLKVGMFSNGTLIDGELAEFLVQNLLFLRVAFDSGERETYRRIHGRDEFDRLLESLRLLVEARRRLEQKQGGRRQGGRRRGAATIGAKYLLSRHNWRELARATELAREIGLDYLQYKLLRDSKFSLEESELEEVRAQVKRAEALRGGSFQVFGSLEKTRVIGRCFLNPIHPVIDASGAVYLCAFFHHRRQRHSIGNVYEKSFPEIWYSERHFEAFYSTRPKECARFDCPFHEAAVLARTWIVENRKHLEFI